MQISHKVHTGPAQCSQRKRLDAWLGLAMRSASDVAPNCSAALPGIWLL